MRIVSTPLTKPALDERGQASPSGPHPDNAPGESFSLSPPPSATSCSTLPLGPLGARKGTALTDGIVGLGYGIGSGAFRGALISLSANLMGGGPPAYMLVGAAAELIHPMA